MTDKMWAQNEAPLRRFPMVGDVVLLFSEDGNGKFRPYAAIVTETSAENELIDDPMAVRLTTVCPVDSGTGIVPEPGAIAYSRHPKSGCWSWRYEQPGMGGNTLRK